MVRVYDNSFSYDFKWHAVTLAYFLRYPNPYSRHVVSSDTLQSQVDPTTGELHITRLHVKRGRLPSTLARFLPAIQKTFILERSVVDVHNQKLTTETRNLDWEGVLSVVEQQEYSPSGDGTNVSTVFKFESRFGKKRDDGAGRRLFGWGAGGVQRSIEMVASSKVKDGLQRSREGMKIVLEQIRERGFGAVVKEQKRGGWERWKNAWREGREEPLA